MNEKKNKLTASVKGKLNKFWQLLNDWPAGISVSYAVTVVLLFYRNNMFDTPPGQVLMPLVLLLAFVYVSYWLLGLVIKDRQSTEIATFTFTLFTVHFDMWFRKLGGFRRLIDGMITSTVGMAILLIIIGFALSAVLGLVAKKHESVSAAINKFLKAVLYSFLAITIGSLIYLGVSNYKIFAFDPSTKFTNVSSAPSEEKLPDIYYFVFDRYANNETMKKYYDFDNQEFIEQLEERGFLINQIEYSNYGHTGPSLSSTLNMDYLDGATEDLPQMYSEMLYGEMINKASALKLLETSGYEIGWSGSWWGPTRTNESADVVYDEVFQANILGVRFTVSEWQELLLGKHLFGRIMASNLPIARSIFHYDKPDRRDIINYQFDSIKDFVDRDSTDPKFGFWHFLTPHTPYVFDENGNVPKYSANQDIKDRPEREKYVQQLKYTNKKIVETIDYILEHSSKQPIIIFQPDEGPYIFKKEDVNQSTISRSEQLRWKHGVTSAFYLPGVKEDEQAVSPVNIFPLIFNTYMGYDFEDLPNRQYNYTKTNPYEFEDITDVINK